MPDALNMSPRLRQHLELVRRHILALRDALALAYATDRILVLPRLPCLCDRSEGPLVLRECRYEASELPTPFVCPLTHIFDIVRFASISPDMANFIPYRGRPGVATVTFRESSFLSNPLTPHSVRTNHKRVHIVRDAAAMRAARARGEASLLRGTSDVQAAAALNGSSAEGGLADAPVLVLESAEGVFGGFVSAERRFAFENMVGQSSMLTGSWCCASWYKPSGSVDFVPPNPTLALPRGCGTASPWESDGAGAAASEPPDSALRAACIEQQERRTRSQRGPVKLEYELRLGKEGVDGYFKLKAAPGDPELCPVAPVGPFNGTLC